MAIDPFAAESFLKFGRWHLVPSSRVCLLRKFALTRFFVANNFFILNKVEEILFLRMSVHMSIVFQLFQLPYLDYVKHLTYCSTFFYWSRDQNYRFLASCYKRTFQRLQFSYPPEDPAFHNADHRIAIDCNFKSFRVIKFFILRKVFLTRTYSIFKNHRFQSAL